MAKGDQKSNREKRKPKADKPAAKPAASGAGKFPVIGADRKPGGPKR